MRKYKRCSVYQALVFFTLFMHSASAADVQKNQQGVWVGTIGKAKVRFCLATAGNQSSYYYEKYQKKIPLWIDKVDPLEMTELDPTKYISDTSDKSNITAELLLSEKGGLLIGTWSTQSKKIPITLKKLVGNFIQIPRHLKEAKESADYYGCPLDFYLPIISKFKSTRGKLDSGNRYEAEGAGLIVFAKTGIDHTIENGFDPKYLKVVNTRLASWIVDLYELSTHDYHFYGTIRYVRESPNYLVLESVVNMNHEGPHDGGGFEEILFEKKTGDQISAATLFKSKPYDDESNVLFKQLIHSLVREFDEYPEEMGCSDTIKNTSFYPSSSTREGIIFGSSSYSAARNCDSSRLIPWGDLLPHLSYVGIQVMKDFSKKALKTK